MTLGEFLQGVGLSGWLMILGILFGIYGLLAVIGEFLPRK